MKSRIVFVYGTLKQGYGNHALLDHGQSVFVGNAVSNNIFKIENVGGKGSFPIITHGDQSVLGELYEVDEETLARLDALEGHPSMYTRTKNKFHLYNPELDIYGDEIEAEYYHWQRGPSGETHNISKVNDHLVWSR